VPDRIKPSFVIFVKLTYFFRVISCTTGIISLLRADEFSHCTQLFTAYTFTVWHDCLVKTRAMLWKWKVNSTYNDHESLPSSCPRHISAPSSVSHRDQLWYDPFARDHEYYDYCENISSAMLYKIAYTHSRRSATADKLHKMSSALLCYDSSAPNSYPPTG